MLAQLIYALVSTLRPSVPPPLEAPLEAPPVHIARGRMSPTKRRHGGEDVGSCAGSGEEKAGSAIEAAVLYLPFRW
jgi:hypothetical protein